MKVLIFSIFPANYRVDVFNNLRKYHDVKVIFEKDNDIGRDKKFFVNNTNNSFEILERNTFKNRFNYLKGVIYSFQPDIVFVYEYNTKLSLNLMLYCIKNKIPYAINCDGGFLNPNPIKKIIKKFFIKRATLCLAGGKSAVDYFKYYGAKENNIYRHNFTSLKEKDIIQNTLSLTEKISIKQKIGLDKDKKYVITVGQFIYRKGFDVLLNAWKEIESNYVLLLIGGGEKVQEYKDFIKLYNIKNIKIIEFLEKQVLFEYYKASEFMVLPTREDIWGLVVNEAMACGLPVITTNRCIAGLELIEDAKNGFIVPVNNTFELAQKIKILIADDILCKNISKNNIIKIKDYTMENVAKSHNEALQRCFRDNIK